MNNINGNMYQKNILRAFQISRISDWAIAGILLLIGFAAVALHARLKTPLHIPGHHGLEFMALFMAGKFVSRYKYSMTISAMGASIFALMPFLSFGNPFMPLTFLLPGIIADFVFNRNEKQNYFFIAIAGGLAYASIPISRELLMFFTGYPFGSLLIGLIYPFSTHFIFGAVGSVLGALIIKKTIRK